ncbi:MAG: T9SS C-terminal target domain-containing protein [Balneola sp.]|nr:MAG: T9SS C-terminal target domain-containing protein [Balneola sp.]
MKKLAIILFTVFIFSSFAWAQVSVGQDAPDFSLLYLGGGQNDRISLEDQEGKVVYIFFYGANCPHCRSNGPVTQTEIFEVFEDDTNFVALGIDTWNANTSSNNSFRNVTGITYPLLLNGRDVLVDYYGNSGAYDRSVVVGADGVLRYRGTVFVNNDFEAVQDVLEAELEKVATNSEEEGFTPSTIQLNQNYPNPFNPSTTISYSIDSPGEVSLKVYNLLGREVATLVNGTQASGNHSIVWNASNVPSGVYVYRLSSGETQISRRMMLIK